MASLAPSFVNGIVFILVDNEDNHKISGEFEIWPDRNMDDFVKAQTRR